MDFAFWYTSSILVAMTLVLIKEVIEPDIVVFSALLLLIVGGVLEIDEALAGFANGGMLTVGFMFIVAESMRQTGVLHEVGSRILGKKEQSITRKLFRFLFPVSAISAFFNNTPIVAMMIPTVHSWAKKHDYPVSKFLIPLSYATILGGACTLIGTSTTLVVHGLMLQNGMQGLGFFEITKFGVPITLFGLLYITLIGHKLLPDRKEPMAELGENTREFVIELKVEANYQHIGKTIEAAGLRHLKGLFLFQIERRKTILAPVGPDEKIHLDDRLFFTGLPATIIELQKTQGLSIIRDTKFDLKNYDSDLLRTYEAVISPSSPLIGENVRESNFRSRYNAVIIAIHRNGERIRQKIGDIILREGDTLLLLARNDFLKRWYNSNDFHLISESEKVPSKPRWYSYFSIFVFVSMVIAMGFNALPIVVVAAIAAMLLIYSRCITPKDAHKSVGWDVLLVIASSFGIARALENSGVAQFLANNVVAVMGGLGTIALLATIYYMTNFYTEIITNNAAAAFIFPIGLATAQQAGLDPRPFVLAIAIGASSSFATPIGYQTNMMVYGPGGYKFRDFLKIGVPMNIMVGLIAITLIYLYYFVQ